MGGGGGGWGVRAACSEPTQPPGWRGRTEDLEGLGCAATAVGVVGRRGNVIYCVNLIGRSEAHKPGTDRFTKVRWWERE
jgi:hypothetical protein